MLLRPLGVVASLFLALGLVAPAVADELPDPTDPTAQLSIDKSASSAEVGPGDTLVYTIQVGCSAISDVGCRDAITTDVVPAPLVILSVVPSGPNDAAEPQINGQNVRVDWTEDLGVGAIGMLDNTTSQVRITVQVPEDVSFDLDGTTLTNQATAEATNALDVSDSVDVTLNVPLDLATSPTKEFAPASALAAVGTPVAASLTGTNDSNATVDTLVIQDPVDPTATPNPFTFLGFTGFGTVSPPQGTTSTTFEVFVNGAWVEVPGGELPPPDPADVRGTRVTFTGAIPPDATGSVDLELETDRRGRGRHRRHHHHQHRPVPGRPRRPGRHRHRLRRLPHPGEHHHRRRVQVLRPRSRDRRRVQHGHLRRPQRLPLPDRLPDGHRALHRLLPAGVHLRRLHRPDRLPRERDLAAP